jgi:hypothetical protein
MTNKPTNESAVENGTATRLHNVKVVQSCRGWKMSDVTDSIADAARDMRYPMEWANGEIHALRRGRLAARHEAARKNPPPYTTREALREATLAVGRKPAVTLVGENGNVFHVIGLVSRALKAAEQPDRAKEFCERALACGSYDAVLTLVHEYAEVR